MVRIRNEEEKRVIEEEGGDGGFEGWENPLWDWGKGGKITDDVIGMRGTPGFENSDGEKFVWYLFYFILFY